MDTLLVSDLLRHYLDGEMEMDRGVSDCYDDLCIWTDDERIVFGRATDFAFAGHHDDLISAREGTIEDRNGIMIGDISPSDRELSDILGIATDREVKGYGGWGEYHGFDALFYDYVRSDRPQRMILASAGGYRSEGNPLGGTLTWTGGAVGVDHSDITTEPDVLVGNSELTVRLDEVLEEYLVRVDITDMVDVANGTTYKDMVWNNIPLRGGGFETFAIKGRFFGPNHEEVGGVFERDQITGAFGAIREE